jgi:hypothetical protein
MRVRLKYVVPFGQMALAVVLLRLIFLWGAATRMDDMPGEHPAFLLLLYLHLPLMLVLRRLVFGSLPELAALVAAIGVFWYWVVLLVHRYRERGTLFPAGWMALRIVADAVLIAMPMCLGWLFIDDLRDYPNIYVLQRSLVGWLWIIPTYGSLLVWILGPIFVFGNDLVRCFRPSSPPRSEPRP